jgi:NADPH-dependent 7-cyano-7-deazaguanine reductase QueF
MLMEGIICYCYFVDINNIYKIKYITSYNDSYKTLNDFHEENGQMISYLINIDN